MTANTITTLSEQNYDFMYQSSTIVIGFLETFGEAISADIKERLSNNQAYSVSADECIDMIGHAVLSTCIHHITAQDGNFKVEKSFISAVTLEVTKSEDITNTLIVKLKKVGLKPENISVVSFDGGANFGGKVSGTQARLQEYAPGLLFVHCRSHLLQLALIHSCRQTPPIKRVLNGLNKLYSPIRGSHKRLSVL